MLAAAALAALSCQKEYSEEDVAEQICESDFVAIAPAETKTSLDGINIHWTKGDQISIFEGTTINHKYQVADNADGKSYASLNRIADDGFAAGASISVNLAFYPYSTETNLDVSDDGNSFTISTTLPSTQAYAENSFGNGVYPMVAMTSSTADKDLCFQNICGNIKIQLKGTAKITSIVIAGNNNEILCGAADMTITSDAVPSLEMKGDGKSVTLDCEDGVQLNEDTAISFVIVLPPVTFTNGFTATVSADDNTSMEISTSKEISITRSTTSKMAAKTYQGKHANIIDFADQAAKYACVEKFDTDGDGEISYAEAAIVTDVSGLFTDWNTVKSFDEFKYFTSVTSVPSSLFDGCTSLESVTLPSTVTSIGSYAFRNCSSLSGIEIPDDVTSIGTCAFQNCSKLTSISLPAKVKTIGNYAFYATGIASVVLPDSVTSLGTYVFYNCTALTSAVLPSGLASISNYAFYGCTSLQTITLPANLTTIGDYVFYNCRFVNPDTHASKIELPSTVTKIGNNNFNAVANVIIPSTSFVEISAATFVTGVKKYVPASMVEKYKLRTNWSSFADYIFPISDYSDPAKITFAAVDLGLSVKWANMNLGASSYADECGEYYAWGEIEPNSGFSWDTYKYCNGSETTLTKYCTSSSFGTPDGKTVLESMDDAATQKLGSGWRMPTYDEWIELINTDNCSWTWIPNIGYVSGYLVTSKKDGYTDKSIFLPATYLNFRNTGRYWTSSLNTGQPYSALFIQFSNSSIDRSLYTYRDNGFSIRPVQE